MTIIHGDNTIKSRQSLVTLVNSYKNKGFSVTTFSAKNLSVAQLEQALGGQSLFGTANVVIVEELHSQQESAKRKQLIALLSNTTAEVILWEKRLLTVPMLKKFPQAIVETHKASSIVFKWLDGLGKKGTEKLQLQQLQEICKQESAQFCFAMLCRQVRLLIASKDDGKVKGAPFVIANLKRQAQLFSLEHLLRLHHSLLEIEFGQKRSLSKLTLEQQLDLFVLDI